MESRAGIQLVSAIHFGKVSMYVSPGTLVAASLVGCIVVASYADVAFAEGFIKVVLAA